MLPHVSKPAKSHYWKVVKERPTFRVQPDERRNADGSHRFPFGVPLCKGKAGGPPMGGWLTVGYSVYVNHGAGHDPGQKQWHVTRAAVTTFNFFTRIFVAQRSFSKQGCLKKTKRPKKHIQCVLLHTTWVWLNPHTHNEVQLCKVNWYQRWWLNQPRKWRPPLTFMRVGGFSLQLTRTCSCPLNTFNMTRRGQAFKSSIRRSVSFLALAPWTSRSLSAKTYSLIVRWAYNPTCQGKKCLGEPVRNSGPLHPLLVCFELLLRVILQQGIRSKGLHISKEWEIAWGVSIFRLVSRNLFGIVFVFLLTVFAEKKPTARQK